MPDSAPFENFPTSSLPNLGKRALHFGAGNIGRGFIGPLLSESGYTVTFADINERVIGKLNEARHYSVEILAENHYTQIIRRVEGLISTSPDVVDLLARQGDGAVDLITTSVGPFVLPRLAPAIAAGFEKRFHSGGGHLNVIACENMIGATHKLADSVLARLQDKPDVLEWVNANVGWANCAVDRIVPPFETPIGASELDVGVEPFFEWTVDQTQLKGTVLVKGMKLVANLEAYVERKLYTLNCGHASLAYLGSLRGYRMIDDTLGDDDIREIVHAALQDSGAALRKKHGFSETEHAEYIELIMQRFSNPVLKDEVKRVGRQPLRKLSPRDRLVGPTNLLRSYDLPRKNLLTSIAAALHFHNEEDEESVELQEKIKEKGVEGVLEEVSGWRLTDEKEAEDIQVVLKEYADLAKWKPGQDEELFNVLNSLDPRKDGLVVAHL